MTNEQKPESNRTKVRREDQYQFDQPVDYVQHLLPAFNHVKPLFRWVSLVYAQFPTWISGKQAAEGGFASGKRRTASRSILVLNRTNVNDNAPHLLAYCEKRRGTPSNMERLPQDTKMPPGNRAAMRLYRLLRHQHVVLALDGLQTTGILLADQRAGKTGVARTAGSADAVDIVFRLVRHIVVDHEIDVVHVDAARGYVGCNEHGGFTRAEFAHNAVALVLRKVAVEAGGRRAAGEELFGYGFYPVPCVAEDQRQPWGSLLHELADGDDFARFRGMHTHLADGLGRFVALADFDAQGIDKVLFGDDGDFLAHGRGKEHGLVLARDIGEDRLDIRQKAEIEHFVRFVKNDKPNVAELECVLADKVLDAAGRADNDLRALTERLQLDVGRLPAVNADGADGQVRGELFNDACGLQREFARGAEDERLYFVVFGLDALHDGDDERRRFAGARLRDAYEVASVHQRFERLLLNGRRGVIVRSFERAPHRCGKEFLI
ncbi:hypothetical protein SDC9_78585 [bioreactor metagenome]|uniref:Uncharacterized protein n=1 Tax=bioreactor metagenome TaxID=1076179 RepID=A0A644YUN2_9ZZZZ